MERKYSQNPHDAFVQKIFSHKEQAEDFLRNYLLQNICKLIDFNSLAIVKDSFVDEDLKKHFSDLLYEVQTNSREGFIYLLFERKKALLKELLLCSFSGTWSKSGGYSFVPLFFYLPYFCILKLYLSYGEGNGTKRVIKG